MGGFIESGQMREKIQNTYVLKVIKIIRVFIFRASFSKLKKSLKFERLQIVR